ncbi:MAG TPA: MoaD/ThiS family protein [Rhizomicrobium sp.]|jgi:hypothetical protein
MAIVHFTARLGSVGPGKPTEIDCQTVGDALTKIFAQHPQVQGYVLDEQGRLRKHVCIFLDGERIAHETALSMAAGPRSEIYVMQALSGG